jgi:hypothetical protein
MANQEPYCLAECGVDGQGPGTPGSSLTVRSMISWVSSLSKAISVGSSDSSLLNNSPHLSTFSRTPTQVTVVDLGSGLGQLMCVAAALLPPDITSEVVGVEVSEQRAGLCKLFLGDVRKGCTFPLKRTRVGLSLLPTRVVCANFNDHKQVVSSNTYTALTHFTGVSNDISQSFGAIREVLLGRSSAVGLPVYLGTTDGVVANFARCSAIGWREIHTLTVQMASSKLSYPIYQFICTRPKQ